MENNELIEKILKLKKQNNVRIIGHSYASEELHPLADSIACSTGFVEAILDIRDNKDVIVLAPTFFAEIARVLLYDKKLTVFSPIIAECPVANYKYLGVDYILEFKKAHPGVPMVCYGVAPMETKMHAEYIALAGRVVDTVNSIDSPEVLFVGEGNCALHAMRKCNKKVIPYPRNPFCSMYNSLTRSDIEAKRKEYPDACIMVHAECNPRAADVADYAMGTDEMMDFVKQDNHQTYVVGIEIDAYRRMAKVYPTKKFIHLSSRLQCNVFKTIRLEDVLACLEERKHVIRVDESIARRIFEDARNGRAGIPQHCL